MIFRYNLLGGNILGCFKSIIMLRGRKRELKVIFIFKFDFMYYFDLSYIIYYYLVILERLLNCYIVEIIFYDSVFYYEV